MIREKILKVRDWLKYQYPDFEGFKAHVEAWEDNGIPYGFQDLLHISEAYNIKPPRVIDGVLTFEFEPRKTPKYIEIDINITPTHGRD